MSAPSAKRYPCVRNGPLGNGAPGEIVRGQTPAHPSPRGSGPSAPKRADVQPPRKTASVVELPCSFVGSSNRVDLNEPARRAVLEPRLGNGAPGEIRTPDPLVRSQVLYPTELQARRGKPVARPEGLVGAGAVPRRSVCAAIGPRPSRGAHPTTMHPFHHPIMSLRLGRRPPGRSRREPPSSY